MTDEHTKGVINTAKGDVKEGVGRLTGDKKLEAKGRIQQVQGNTQKGLDDVQKAVRIAGRNRT